MIFCAWRVGVITALMILIGCIFYLDLGEQCLHQYTSVFIDDGIVHQGVLHIVDVFLFYIIEHTLINDTLIYTCSVFMINPLLHI